VQRQQPEVKPRLRPHSVSDHVTAASDVTVPSQRLAGATNVIADVTRRPEPEVDGEACRVSWSSSARSSDVFDDDVDDATFQDGSNFAPHDTAGENCCLCLVSKMCIATAVVCSAGEWIACTAGGLW